MIDFAQKVPTERPDVPSAPPATSPTPTLTPTLTPSTPTSTPFPRAELERLGDEIAELAAHIHAATYRLLVLIREFDQREGWDASFKTCAHWLSWRTGIALGPAREKVRVAHALEHLPGLSARMQSGELSYSKVRAVTRVATPENEEELMDFARHGTASHVEKLVRAWRRVDRLEDQWQERERHRTRSVTLWPDGDGMYELRGKLDPEVGVMLKRALEAASGAIYRRSGEFSRPEAPEDPELTAAQIRADAIGLLAERALRGGGLECDGEVLGRADRFQVVLHVDAETLAESSESSESSELSELSDSSLSSRSSPPPRSSSPSPLGGAVFEDGVRVPAGTSRRIACDASRVIMTHDRTHNLASDITGSVLDVGRRTRTVPPAIRRALDHRDGGCRFPACGLRFCDAHHIKHWSDGGETKLANMLLLCRRHHRAVHEEGFRVEIVRDGVGSKVAQRGASRRNVRFYWPDGRPFPDVPPALKLPDDPVAALESKHSQLGIHVDPETTTPLWNGERFDVGYAIHTMWRP